MSKLSTEDHAPFVAIASVIVYTGVLIAKAALGSTPEPDSHSTAADDAVAHAEHVWTALVKAGHVEAA